MHHPKSHDEPSYPRKPKLEGVTRLTRRIGFNSGGLPPRNHLAYASLTADDDQQDIGVDK